MEQLVSAGPSVVEFLERNDADEDQTEENFATLDERLQTCLQQAFGQSLSAEDQLAVCSTCKRLLGCLVRLIDVKTETLKELKFTSSLQLCCTVFILSDYNISARESLVTLLGCLRSTLSVIDVFKIAKRLSVDRSCKDISPYIDETTAVIIQALLWRHDSALWKRLSYRANENEMNLPSYEIIRDENNLLIRNQNRQSAASNVINSSEADASKSTTLLLAPPIVSMLYDVYCYAFERFKRLSEILSTTDLLQDMWTVFNYIMSNHCQKILYNRHLDQIIICTIYAVCKAKMAPMQRPNFKDVTQFYADLVHSDPNVLEVFLGTEPSVEQELKNGNLFLMFYNNTFLPPIRKFIQAQVVENSSLQHSPIPTHRDSSVCITNNVYVSPLRKGLASPQRSMEYKFSSSPSSQLRNINEMLKKSPGAKRDLSSAQKPQPTKIKRISFQKDENSEKVRSTSLLR